MPHFKDTSGTLTAEPRGPHAAAPVIRAYQQCSVSILDTLDDPGMTFDAQGRSQYYHDYLRAEAEQVRSGPEAAELIDRLAATLKRDGRGRPYDCILGLSGGVDSTYLARFAKELGLRPLAVHLDNGWNSELAVKNIENIVNRLGIDLHTYVIDWEEFRDLQVAYLKASVVDIEIPTDQAIVAALVQLSEKFGIKHVLSGHNVVTEHVLPAHWIFNKTDCVNIRAIHQAFGTVPLKTYPMLGSRLRSYYRTLRGSRWHAPLNWVPYNKAVIKERIATELGWRDYGGKHFESIFTRFYQGYILPEKFGIDKRKAHLSNLIFSGQMSKREALDELAKPVYDPGLLTVDKEFVLKKFELSEQQLAHIMAAPQRPHTDFQHDRSYYDALPLLRPFKRWVTGLKDALLTRAQSS